MQHETTGRIHGISDTEKVSERFRKRVFVLVRDTDTRFPQVNEFQLQGEWCSMIDGYHVGDEIEVKWELKGREWTSPEGIVKIFTTLHVMNITAVGSTKRDEPDGGSTPGDDVGF